MGLGNFLTENHRKSSLASNVLAHFYRPWCGSQRGMGNPDHGNPVVPEEALLDFCGTALGDTRKGFVQKEDGFSLGQQPKQGLHDFHLGHQDLLSQGFHVIRQNTGDPASGADGIKSALSWFTSGGKVVKLPPPLFIHGINVNQ